MTVLLVACTAIVVLATAAATRNVTVGGATLEVLSSPLPGGGHEYHGIGSVWIDGTRVRSGRLPWHVKTETWSGVLDGTSDGISDTRFASLEVATAELIGVEQSSSSGVAKVHVKLNFARQLTQQLLDMNLDPVHDSTDWGARPYGRTTVRHPMHPVPVVRPSCLGPLVWALLVGCVPRHCAVFFSALHDASVLSLCALRQCPPPCKDRCRGHWCCQCACLARPTNQTRECVMCNTPMRNARARRWPSPT